MEHADRMSRPKQLCRFEKGGGQIAFLLTDMESGGFELKLIRSVTNGREVQALRIREGAVAELRRQVSCYVGTWMGDRVDRR